MTSRVVSRKGHGGRALHTSIVTRAVMNRIAERQCAIRRYRDGECTRAERCTVVGIHIRVADLCIAELAGLRDRLDAAEITALDAISAIDALCSAVPHIELGPDG